MHRLTTATRLIPALLFAGALAACSPASEPQEPAHPPTDSNSGDQTDGAEDACIVGTWQLDVPDYAAQSEFYLTSIGVPITEFDMTGAGTIQFTSDGLVSTDIALTTSGTIVSGDAVVPISVPSVYTATGDWSEGSAGETIDLANWSTVPGDAPVDPGAPQIPAIDYTDIPTVGAVCSADLLVLTAPGAPLQAAWTR